MTNEVAVIKQEAESAFLEVLKVAKESAERYAIAEQAMDPVSESMAMAFGIASIHDAIKSHQQSVAVIQRMAGHKWGFRTDQDNYDGSGTTYRPEVLIPCFAEAMMNHLRPVGNEFNVISSSMYTTKEGWTGKLERLPGVTEVDSRPGSIVDFEAREFTTKKGAVKKKITASVSATADCKVWGEFIQVKNWKTADVDERLQLSVVADEIDEALDQLKGKADARILERLFIKVKALAMAGPQGSRQGDLPAIAAEATTSKKQKAIDVTPAAGTEAPSDERALAKAGFDGWIDRAQKRITDEEQLRGVNEYWDAIKNAKNKNELRVLHQDLTKTQVKTLGKNNVDELCRFILFTQESVPEMAEVSA